MKTLLRPNHETTLADTLKPEAESTKVTQRLRYMGAVAVELVQRAPITFLEYQSLKNEHRERLGLPVRSDDEGGEAALPNAVTVPEPEQHIHRRAA